MIRHLAAWSRGSTVASVLLVAAGLVSRTAWADTAGSGAGGQPQLTVTQANELARRGASAFQEGNYSEAAEMFQRAYEARKLPSVGLYLARSLVQLARLREARAIYEEVGTLSADAGNRWVQQRAQADAATELTDLVPRIPTITIELTGVPLAEAEITIDGRGVEGDPSQPMALDPGPHDIQARREDQVTSSHIELAEGERQVVALELEPPEPDRPPPPQPASPPPPPPPEQQQVGPSPVVWAALGVGAAGVVVGGVTGAMGLSKRRDLDDQGCVDARCPTALEDDVKSLNGLRTVSTVGFVVGGLGLATGAALYFSGSRSTHREQEAPLAFWVSPTSAGVKGVFR